jgi:hypothetical protein
MAKQKVEDVEEEEEQGSKSEKATAIALFKSFPKEVQNAIDEFVKQFKSTGEQAQTIMQLAEKHGLSKEEIAHVIKQKMKALGLKPPNVNLMLGITKVGTEAGEIDEAAKEAAEAEEEGLPYISVSLKGMNKNEVIAGINTSNVMNVYYSEEDNSFVRIEFE